VVSVILVNYKTPELTQKAARSVLSDPAVSEVIIVENGSGRDDARVLEEAFAYETKVQVLDTGVNLGFGGGNNAGAKIATGKYLFLLNSDAELTKGELGSLVQMLEANPTLGAVSPRVLLPDGTPQPDAMGLFPTGKRILTRESTTVLLGEAARAPEWISGCALFLKADDYWSVGGFDESIFMYLEDVLLCWRLAEKGKGVAICEEAQVVHLGGASKASTLRQKQHYYRAQDYYLKVTGEPFFTRMLIWLLRWPVFWLKSLMKRS
jgi:GT2 family glycosyltransferase